MKKLSAILGLCGGLTLVVAGCATKPSERHEDVVLAAPPPPDAVSAKPAVGNSRFWYRMHHRIFSDGYSFTYDPYNHDKLAPTLGIDRQFPPAPQPYKDLE